MKNIVFQLNDTIQVFRLGKSKNKKITPDNKLVIMQSYTFSVDQFEYVRTNLEKDVSSSMIEFFNLDQKNCFDCPFASNKGCYTHKFTQYLGFLGMLKSIARHYKSIDNIPVYSEKVKNRIVELSTGKYVRFGSYGEPSMHPIELVESVANVARNYTGYTHQWHRKPEFLKWFMASVHNTIQANTVKKRFNARSFLAVTEMDNVQAVQCPASKESGYKSNCADCGLCSGTTGKGKKDVVILEH